MSVSSQPQPVTEALAFSRISERLDAVGIEISDADIADCARFLALLARWNQKINLTSFQLAGPLEDRAIDRLIIEPLVATTLGIPGPGKWWDVGSGGGSPAIPMRIVWRNGRLIMVDSRQRKSAFLREAVRELGLEGTEVICERLENLAIGARANLVTVRAVRIDASVADLLARMLAIGGFALAFGSLIEHPSLVRERAVTLPTGSDLNIYRRVIDAR